MIKITTGRFEVISSGLVHLFADEESCINLRGLIIKICFKDDGGQPSIKGEGEDNSILKLTLFNFFNSLGQGNTDAAEIGQLDGHKLFLIFRVFSLKEKKIRTFEYTFYLQNE